MSAACSSTSRCQTRRALCRCFQGAFLSASSQASIIGFQGPTLGAARAGAGLRGGQRRRQRLADIAPVHVKTLGQGAHAQAFALVRKTQPAYEVPSQKKSQFVGERHELVLSTSTREGYGVVTSGRRCGR
jgi:hypothetical protein